VSVAVACPAYYYCLPIRAYFFPLLLLPLLLAASSTQKQLMAGLGLKRLFPSIDGNFIDLQVLVSSNR